MDGVSNFIERTVNAIVNHHAYQALLPEQSKETESDGQSSSPFDDDEQRFPTTYKDEFVPKLIAIVKSLLFCLLPSFVKDLRHTSKPVRVPPTAYLNGLRGIAAYIVSCQHFTTIYYSGEPLWGYGARPQDVWITQLPFLRLFYCGSFMVTIFFILSGYVLSYRPLKLARASENQALFNNLTSAVFRRGPRLFLPLLGPMLIVAIPTYYGFSHSPQHPMDDNAFVLAGQPSLWGDFGEIFWSWERLINPFLEEIYYPRDVPTLWTLPMEFRGSIVVFILVLALARARPTMRMLTLGALSWYSMFHGRWDTFLFIVGIVLAELRLIKQESTYCLEDFIKNDKIIPSFKRIISSFWVALLIVSLYFGSWPVTGSASSPGYQTLTAMTPSSHQGTDASVAYFWCSIASVGLLLALENFEVLQKPFASAAARYMGDISFSLYIVHVPILLSIGRLITVGLIRWTGHFTLGVCLGGITLFPILITVSDLCWRLFDQPSVTFSSWLAVYFFR